jgi:2'-hydroxyisoflavone reductase
MHAHRRRVIGLAAAALAGAAAAPYAQGGPPAQGAPMKKLRILILGGTGFIGPHQVEHALARGHQVTVFNRGRQGNPWAGKVEELIGDRNTGDLAALAGREWDVCIDNPTSLPFWVRDAGKALAGKVGQYIFISTISVYAKNDTPADETDTLEVYKGGDPLGVTPQAFAADVNTLYGPLKAASEAEARRQFGAAVTTVRPGLIVGPGDPTDRFTYWPVRLARGGEVLAPGDGSDPVQFIDVRDLDEWTIRLAEQRAFGIFNATGPDHTLTTAAMLAGVGKAVGGGAKLVWVPASFLDANKVSPWGDMPVWIPGKGDSAGFHRRNIGRALAAGLTFRPLETTAADTLAWFKQQPPDRQAKLRAGLSPEREAELLAKWKASA